MTTKRINALPAGTGVTDTSFFADEDSANANTTEKLSALQMYTYLLTKLAAAPLPLADGGTNAALTASNNSLVYSSATALALLATANNGILITNGSGVPSISSTLPSAVQGNITTVGTVSSGTWNGTVVDVAHGGSGVASATAYSVLCGGTTSTGALQSVSGVGTSGQVLKSNGAGQLPTWQTDGSGSGITTVNGDSGSVTGTTVTLRSNVAAQNCGSTVLFSGSSSTMTMNVTDADFNTILGNASGSATQSGQYNTGFGDQVLPALTTADYNSVFGAGAGNAIDEGNGNSAFGYSALLTATGAGTFSNCAFGAQSLQDLVSGVLNSCFGRSSGASYTGSESNNIIVGLHNGVTGENNTTRIGYSSAGAAQQTACYVDGIAGVTVTGTAVLVSATGQLGIAVSSRRFKENIVDMDDASNAIFKLRPVLFNYKDHAPNEIQRGLIAEEVQEVIPELVLLDDKGIPAAVKYQELPILLLNEIKKIKSVIDELQEKVNLLYAA